MKYLTYYVSGNCLEYVSVCLCLILHLLCGIALLSCIRTT